MAINMVNFTSRTETGAAVSSTTAAFALGSIGSYFAPAVLASAPVTANAATTPKAEAGTSALSPNVSNSLTPAGSPVLGDAPVQTAAPASAAPSGVKPAETAPAIPANAIKVSSAAELLTALKAAKGGETIAVAAGNYGNFTISGVNPASNVTIVSASNAAQANFRQVSVLSSSNLTFRSIQVRFTPDMDTRNSSSAFRIAAASNIVVDGITLKGGNAVNGVAQDSDPALPNPTGTVFGLPAGRGLWIEKSNNITFKNSDVSVFDRGMVVGTSNNVSIINNEVHDLRKTPFAAAAVNDLVVSGNHFHDFQPWKLGGFGDHGDMIHIWNSGSQTTPNKNITITNNFFDQGKGQPLLGVFIQGSTTAPGSIGVNISNNVIFNGSSAGVRLGNVKGVVENNTLINPPGSPTSNAPGMLILNNSAVTIKNNFTSQIAVYAGATSTQSGNTLIQRDSTAKPSYYSATTVYKTYAQVFTNGLTSTPKVSDFTVKLSSLAGSGANLALLNTSSVLGSVFSGTPVSSAPAVAVVPAVAATPAPLVPVVASLPEPIVAPLPAAPVVSSSASVVSPPTTLAQAAPLAPTARTASAFGGISTFLRNPSETSSTLRSGTSFSNYPASFNFASFLGL